MTSKIQTEKGLEDALKKWLLQQPDCIYFKVVGGPYQDPSWPDLLLGWRGRLVTIELKEPGRLGGKVSIFLPKPKDKREKLQQIKINAINQAGSIGVFADDLDAIIIFLLDLPGCGTNEWLLNLYNT